MASERLQVILELVTGQYKREAREAATATGKIGDAATTAAGGTSRLTGSIASFARVAGTAFAAAGIADFARDSIMAASDLEESINAVNVVFGDAGKAIHEFGETSVDSVGLAAVNVNSAATVLGSSLINAGLDADTAAAKVIDLTTRASDMASVFNTEVPDALGAIQSALRGETDPIEKFGVSLTAAAVDAEAAALGYERVSGQFDTTAKTAARLSLIMKQTERVQGDFQNTSDGTANTLKRMNERFLETKARVGTALMPAFMSLLEVAEDLAPVFEDVAIAIADIVAEAAPLIEGLGTLIEKYHGMKEAGEEWSRSNNPLVAGIGEFVSKVGPLAVLTGNYTDAARAAADVTDQRLNPSFKEAGEKSKDAGRGAEYMADAVKDDMVPAVQGAIDPLKRLADGQRTAAEKTRDHLDALIALSNRLVASINPAVNAYQALQDLESAQDDARVAAEEHGVESEEFAAAQLEVAEKTALAQGALSTFGINADSSARAVATALGIPLEAAEKLLDTLGLLDGTVINLRLDWEIEALERGVIPEGMGIRSTINTATQSLSGRRAMGGPVMVGQPYLVGERGPEVMWPSQSGSIISNSNLMKALQGGPTINVYSPTNNLKQDLQYAALLANIATLN